MLYGKKNYSVICSHQQSKYTCWHDRAERRPHAPQRWALLHPNLQKAGTVPRHSPSPGATGSIPLSLGAGSLFLPSSVLGGAPAFPQNMPRHSQQWAQPLLTHCFFTRICYLRGCSGGKQSKAKHQFRNDTTISYKTMIKRVVRSHIHHGDKQTADLANEPHVLFRFLFDSVYLRELYLLPTKAELFLEVAITDISSCSPDGGNQDRALLYQGRAEKTLPTHLSPHMQVRRDFHIGTGMSTELDTRFQLKSILQAGGKG